MSLTPHHAALLCAGLLLQTGMLLGVWKYWQIRHDPAGQAHEYVSIAHRAALMYAFACVLIAALVERTALPEPLAWACVLGMVASFAVAVLSYTVHGLLRDTDNQFRAPHRLGRATVHPVWVDAVMVSKALVELLAGGALLYGFVLARQAG